MEIYKPIPNTNNEYLASNYGNIKTVKKDSNGLVMSPRIDKGNYRMVNLWLNGKRKTYRVHVLVALTFLGETPKGYHIDHIDRNKANNRLDNLQFLTARENVVKSQIACKESNYPTGVSFSSKGKYRSMIRHGKNKYHLGVDKTPELSHKRYLTALEQIEKGVFNGDKFRFEYDEKLGIKSRKSPNLQASKKANPRSRKRIDSKL